jgi:hypothetical protein
MVGAVQILVFLTPIAAGYLFSQDKLGIHDLDLSTLSFEPGTMVVGTLLLLGGFLVCTGLLVAIGAIMPTAKDAGTIFGPLMALIFIPFYAVSLIISDPGAHRADLHVLTALSPRHRDAPQWLRQPRAPRIHHHRRRTLHHRIPHPPARRPPLPLRIHPILRQTLHRWTFRKLTPATGK